MKKIEPCIKTIEKGVCNGKERLIEIIPAATGEGWIYKPGQFITPWEGDGHFSARYLNERDKNLLAEVAGIMSEKEFSDWEDPSIIIVAGSVYLATTDNLCKGKVRYKGIVPARGDKYYRPFWRYGDAEMLIWESQNPQKEEETGENWGEDDEYTVRVSDL